MRGRASIAAAEASRRSVEILADLISIPTYQDSEVAIEYLSKRLERYGIRYHVDLYEGCKYNLVAEVNSRKPGKTLILNSHIDTVPPGNYGWSRDPFKAEAHEGRIYGLGACDAKSSLSAMVAAFEAIAETGVLSVGKVVLAAVSGEETGGLGTQIALTEGLTGTAVIIGEPTRIIPRVAHKGVLRCYVDVKGKAAHASTPELGINSISKMAKIVLALDELAKSVKAYSDEICGSASLAITMIEGGRTLNVVPDSCRISIDRRLVPGEEEEQAFSELKSVIENRNVWDYPFGASVSKLRFLPPSKTDPNHELVLAARRAIRAVTGTDPGCGGFEASCDMTFFSNRAMIPGIILGPGDLALAHQVDEYVEEREVRLAADVYVRTVLEYL